MDVDGPVASTSRLPTARSPSPPKRARSRSHTPADPPARAAAGLAASPSHDGVEDGFDPESSPGADAEAPERRVSMYVAAFEEMQTVVLGCPPERALFSQRELDALERFAAMSYEARYLFVRLFLRKNGWFRVRALDYSAEIGDVAKACEEMCAVAAAEGAEDATLPPSPSPKAPQLSASPEVIDLDGDDDDEAPSAIPAKLLAKAADRTPAEKPEPRPTALLGVSTTALQFGRDESGEGLEHFAWDTEVLRARADVDEVLAMLSLDELKLLAKRMQVPKPGTTRASIIAGLKKASGNQSTLFGSFAPASAKGKGTPARQLSLSYDGTGKKQTQQAILLERAFAIIGPAVRLSVAVRALYARLHLIFHRSLVFNDKTLTSSVLARAKKRVFPRYVVARTGGLLFESRARLLEYEEALRIERKMEDCLGLSSESWKTRADNPERDWRREGEKEALAIFELAWPVWKRMVGEQMAKERESGPDADDKSTYYRKRFHPGWPLTRVVYKGAYVLGRMHDWEREAEVHRALLAQTVFRRGKRGVWYDRLALILMTHVGTDKKGDADEQAELRREAQVDARQLCIDGLADPYTHLIYHQSLQRRIKRLENALKTPSKLRHDFVDAGLRAASKRVITGEKLSEGETGKKSVWRANDGAECSVEQLSLDYYVRVHGFKGFHSENGILTTIFSLLFFDVLFMPIEGAFETAYQNAPLDLATDAFAISRQAAIAERLQRLEDGDGPAILREVDERERDRQTWAVGVRWSYTRDDLAEIVDCFGGHALAAICRVYAEEFGHRVGGVPDLCLWKPGHGVRLVEVKGPGDRLSETQKVWIDVLLGAGVEVELCSVVEADEAAALSDSGSAASDSGKADVKKKRRKSVKAKSETPAPAPRKKAKIKSETPAPLVRRSVQPADVEIIDVDAMPDTPPRPRKKRKS